jgi:hypothetical protein
MKKISLAVPLISMKNKKAELTFGCSAMLKLLQHPPLSVLFSRRVWLYRVTQYFLVHRYQNKVGLSRNFLKE